ncbi:MAG: hypothetical protein O3B01_02230 [Planctomycetota bacterium]|nr:hypothetical protein [Planctomycetota bacterium]
MTDQPEISCECVMPTLCVPDLEELKKKHGIDYDTHSSYRFTEE